jgi:hypothetical protein
MQYLNLFIYFKTIYCIFIKRKNIKKIYIIYMLFLFPLYFETIILFIIRIFNKKAYIFKKL